MGMATVDVCGMCIYAFFLRGFASAMHGQELCEKVYQYISAWASALLVQLYRAMRRPQSVGRVTVRLPRFFYAAKPISLTLTAFSGAKCIKVSCLCSSIVIKFTVHQYPCSKISGLGRRKTLKREEQ